MTIHTTYSRARASFASLWDEAASSRQAVIIERRGAEDMALVPAAELDSLMETAYLLRSPENAKRLLAALARAREGSVATRRLADLMEEVGLGAAE